MEGVRARRVFVHTGDVGSCRKKPDLKGNSDFPRGELAWRNCRRWGSDQGQGARAEARETLAWGDQHGAAPGCCGLEGEE